MSDLTSMLPVGRPVQIGGRTFNIVPLSIAEISHLQAWIKRTYPHPLDALRGRLDGLTPDERSMLIKSAEEKAGEWPPRLGSPEAEMHMRGIEGMQEVCRMMLQKADPSLDDDAFQKLIGGMSAAKFFKVMEDVLAVALGDDEDDPKDGDAAAEAATA